MAVDVALLVWLLGVGTMPAVREAGHPADTIEYHVRTTDPLVRARLANGAAESRTLRDLLAQLVASDIIVHVTLVDRIAGGASGQLYFVTATPTARYLRAEIIRSANRADMIALIAHELQHAAEVARAAQVRDSASMSTFYLGMRDNANDPGRYDSAAARDTESAVRREVIAHRGAPDDELQLLAQARRSVRTLR
jgi:hypothetical protein